MTDLRSLPIFIHFLYFLYFFPHSNQSEHPCLMTTISGSFVDPFVLFASFLLLFLPLHMPHHFDCMMDMCIKNRWVEGGEGPADTVYQRDPPRVKGWFSPSGQGLWWGLDGLQILAEFTTSGLPLTVSVAFQGCWMRASWSLSPHPEKGNTVRHLCAALSL